MFKKSLFALTILSASCLMPLQVHATSYETDVGNDSSQINETTETYEESVGNDSATQTNTDEFFGDSSSSSSSGSTRSDSSSSSSSSSSTNSQEHFSVFDILNVEDSQNLGGTTPLADEIRTNAEKDGGAGSVVAALILRAINLLLLTIGTFAFLTIFYAGVLMTTSNGDEGKIDKAKGIITQSILGLVFSFLAYFIVTFVQSFFY